MTAALIAGQSRPMRLAHERIFVTPAYVPRVCHEPIRHAVFGAPAENSDGVDSQKLIAVVLINPAFVGWKIGENEKSGFYRAVLVYVSLDLRLILEYSVDFLCEVLVLVVALLVALAANVLTLWRWFRVRAVRLARWKAVGLAAVFSAVQASGHDTFVLVILPRRCSVPTVAPITAAMAACDEILGRNVDLYPAVRVDADSVRN